MVNTYARDPMGTGKDLPAKMDTPFIEPLKLMHKRIAGSTLVSLDPGRL